VNLDEPNQNAAAKSDTTPQQANATAVKK